MTDKPLMIFDVESVGLNGEGFAVGVVVVDQKSKAVLEKAYFACPHSSAQGKDEDRKWIESNVIPYLPPPNLTTTEQVREEFWQSYRRIVEKHPDASIWADCGYPVEYGFMKACTQDLSDRIWQAPYPLQEIATIRTALGLDPTLAYDLPPDKRHNPLEECLYIAPKLADWLGDFKKVLSLY